MWPFKQKKHYVKIGSKRFVINPLTLPQIVELILLLSPYWPVLEASVPRIDAAIANKQKNALSEIFFVLRERMKDTPGDITKLVAILIGVEAEWLAKNGSAQDIVLALPTLDKAHDLGRLWRILREGSVYLTK